MTDVLATQYRHQQRRAKPPKQAGSHAQGQDMCLELQGGFQPLFGSVLCSMKISLVEMAAGARRGNILLHTKRPIATATCATFAACRRSCLCSFHPASMELGGFVTISNMTDPHEPFRIFSCTATLFQPQSLVFASRPLNLYCTALPPLVNSSPVIHIMVSKREPCFYSTKYSRDRTGTLGYTAVVPDTCSGRA